MSKIKEITKPRDMFNMNLWKKWVKEIDIFTTSYDHEVEDASKYIVDDGIRGPILVEKASGEHIQADDIAHGYKVGGG